MQNTAKPFVAHAAERTQEEQMLMAAHAHQQRSTSPRVRDPTTPMQQGGRVGPKKNFMMLRIQSQNLAQVVIASRTDLEPCARLMLKQTCLRTTAQNMF